MSKKRIRKYQMVKIPDAISELGGYSARFLGDESGTTDAFDEVLPATIDKSGIKVSAEVAKAVTTQFLLDCIDYVARTGETLVINGVLMIRLSIRGSFKNKDSQAKADNVHVSVFLLNEAKPKMAFSMSNALEGKTLLLTSATTPGSPFKHVVQGAEVLINGQYTKILEGDKVTASVKGTDGMTFEAECEVLESDDSHILVQMPEMFNDPALVGKEITFTVESRCGDPDAGTQTKNTTATLDKGEAPTGPRITGVGGDTRVSKSAGDLTVSGVNLAERREDWGAGETRLELNIKKSPDDVWNTLSPSAEFGIVDPCDAHTVTLKASELYSSAFTIDDPVPGQEYPLKLVAYVNGVKANEFEFTGIGA